MDQVKLNLGGDTLVLNMDGKPLSVLPISTMTWKDAILNVISDNVEVLEEYEDWVIRSQLMSFPVPAVVMTRHWVPKGRIVRFSSSNVFVRDDHICQYCGGQFTKSDLTKEHVIPRVLGGLTNWTNITSSCAPCNTRKSHLLTMKPNRIPRKPSYGELVAKVKNYPIKINHSSWNNYLQWPEDKITLVPRRTFLYDLHENPSSSGRR